MVSKTKYLLNVQCIALDVHNTLKKERCPF